MAKLPDMTALHEIAPQSPTAGVIDTFDHRLKKEYVSYMVMVVARLARPFYWLLLETGPKER